MSENNYSKLLSLGIPLKRSSGQTKTVCPKCSATRQPANRNEACLSVNVDEGKYSCHNCNWQGNVNFVEQERKFVVPVWTNATKLSDGLVQYWSARGISQSLLIAMHIKEDVEWMPYPGYPIWTMQFPYIRNGEVINIKYRGEVDSGTKNPDGSIKYKKAFKMVKDAEKIFYNIDSIKDSHECLITEGEPDCMSFVESGYLPVVSVPNGATKANNNLTYLDNCIDYFENKTRIYIGVDNDEAGRALAKELIRRLGAERCWLINYADCKDGNEFMVKYGKIALAQLPSLAKAATIEGIVEIDDMADAIDDLYNNGLPRGLLVNVKEIDEHISFPLTAFIVLTGIPNHGKSPFADYLVERLVVIHDLKCAYFSPENEPNALHAAGIISLLTGKSFERKYGETKHINVTELQMAKKFMQKHYYFISEETNEGYANQFTLPNFTVDNILDYAKKMVMKYGINILVIDPWNTLDHQYGVGQDKLDYISKALDKFRNFAKRYNVLVLLIAHPTKMQKELVKVRAEENGVVVMKEKWKFKVPDLSNVADSGHFHNKPAIGMTFYRDYDTDTSDMIINKMKHKHVGHHGSVTFRYDHISGRFNVDGCKKDEGNHLLTPPLAQGYFEPNSVIINVPIVTQESSTTEEAPF